MVSSFASAALLLCFSKEKSWLSIVVANSLVSCSQDLNVSPHEHDFGQLAVKLWQLYFITARYNIVDLEVLTRFLVKVVRCSRSEKITTVCYAC